MTAGKLRERLHFQRRGPPEDEYGNPQSGEFETVFTAAAELIPMRGSEPVIAARLTGVQPYIVRVYSTTESRLVSPAWRAVDARNPNRIFNITAAANVDQKNRMIDFMATQGVAT